MKKMLINATQPEELRVALVDGQRLYDLDIENRSRRHQKANIYKGKISRVEPSLEAAFVEFGADRHGFLPMREIAPEYFKGKPKGGAKGGEARNIRELVREGTEVVVQVDKEERGSKGAALTTFASLAGRYLVLMPNNPRAGGISRRIEGDERSEMREILSGLNFPDGMGVIVRTAGIGRELDELQGDLDYLLELWAAVAAAGKRERVGTLLLKEDNVILRAIRDYLRDDINQVLIDAEGAHREALEFVDRIMPRYRERIQLYEDAVPIFNRYQVESQIETAFQRAVRLPSGGAIVIDPTEAMVTIDINSAKATRGGDIEETATQTNLEAADEIARQLRLRDIGGLIVIDFIDMAAGRNQRAVESRLRDALRPDRARVQYGRISRFGLMEMSRQRLRPSLGDTSGITCPRCSGQGFIRDTRSLSLSILRLMEEEAMKERTTEVQAFVPVPVATYLLNEKGEALADIKARTGARLAVMPKPGLDTPHYEVERLRDGQVVARRISTELDAGDAAEAAAPAPEQQAAVQGSSIAPPPAAAGRGMDDGKRKAPARGKRKKPGLFKRMLRALFGGGGGGDGGREREARSSRSRGRQSQARSRPFGRAERGRSDSRQQRAGRGRGDSQQQRAGGRGRGQQRQTDGGSGGRERHRDAQQQRQQPARGRQGGRGSPEGRGGQEARGGRQRKQEPRRRDDQRAARQSQPQRRDQRAARQPARGCAG